MNVIERSTRHTTGWQPYGALNFFHCTFSVAAIHWLNFSSSFLSPRKNRNRHETWTSCNRTIESSEFHETFQRHHKNKSFFSFFKTKYCYIRWWQALSHHVCDCGRTIRWANVNTPMNSASVRVVVTKVHWSTWPLISFVLRGQHISLLFIWLYFIFFLQFLFKWLVPVGLSGWMKVVSGCFSHFSFTLKKVRVRVETNSFWLGHEMKSEVQTSSTSRRLNFSNERASRLAHRRFVEGNQRTFRSKFTVPFNPQTLLLW